MMAGWVARSTCWRLISGNLRKLFDLAEQKVFAGEFRDHGSCEEMRDRGAGFKRHAFDASEAFGVAVDGGER